MCLFALVPSSAATQLWELWLSQLHFLSHGTVRHTNYVCTHTHTVAHKCRSKLNKQEEILVVWALWLSPDQRYVICFFRQQSWTAVVFLPHFICLLAFKQDNKKGSPEWMCIKHCRKVYHRARKELFHLLYKLHEECMWKWLLRRQR